MATDKQIAANRANASHSKGPSSAAGRARSSLNAYRHGLSLPVLRDPNTIGQYDALIGLLGGIDESSAFAEAHLDLMRIRQARFQALLTLFTSDFVSTQPTDLRVFDRYERLALARRRKFGQALDPGGQED